jgi:UDP-N-acetylmuramate--alanine ligase
MKGEDSMGRFELKVPGRHNALNALAAALTGHVAGLTFERCLEGIGNYEGVDRRFQKKASVHGVDYYDDYGHHPTEVKAVIAAFKEQYPDRRLIVLFQPHRYSRTEFCWKDFLTCFEGSDELYLLDVYAAGESPIAGIHSKKLAEQIRHKSCTYLESKTVARDTLVGTLKNGDIFVTLGAGDVYKLGEELYLRGKK